MPTQKSIFVFAYYSYKDPVFQSAVLPYLKKTQCEGLRFILLTWEQDSFELTANEKKNIRAELMVNNIFWHDTKWHSGKFKVLKKIYDFTFGLIFSLTILIRYKVSKIYSEGFPGAIIGHYLSKISGKPHIIHTFEPHADYMLESDVWQQKSWEYRFLKKMEVKVGNHAQHIITATTAYKEVLIKKEIATSIHVIPSCIDTEKYFFDKASREKIRSNLGLNDNQIVIVYLGKIGGMYMEEELFKFFQHCLTLDKDRFFFLLFTNYPLTELKNQLKTFDIPENKVFTKFLIKSEVGSYLSAADLAFCGIRPIPSRRYSSPIKNGEYWACGLPILIPEGISDDYVIAEKLMIGKSFKNINQISLTDIDHLTTLDRKRIMQSAQEIRGLKSYVSQFKNILLD